MSGGLNLKDEVVARMGLLGQMTKTRDINAAWDMAKKKAAREYPLKFVLDGRRVLHWRDKAPKELDREISAKNFKKLNELADKTGCSVDQVVDTLIKSYKMGAKTKKS
jgi:hypothetical protein